MQVFDMLEQARATGLEPATTGSTDCYPFPEVLYLVGFEKASPRFTRGLHKLDADCRGCLLLDVLIGNLVGRRSRLSVS